MSRYAIKEVFDTLQGEGSRAGARSVFVRFSGCNLWDGRAHTRDRGQGACARWCDTDFAKGTPMDAARLLELMDAAWPRPADPLAWRWCVLTGGEPALQIDEGLVRALKDAGWRIAVETNGSVACPALFDCDHVTISPKKGADVVLGADVVDEVKVVLPGVVPGEVDDQWTDEQLEGLESRFGMAEFYVQPMDPLLGVVPEVTLLRHGEADEERELSILQTIYNLHVNRCLAFVAAHPHWRFGVQLHKYVGLP